MTPRESVVRSVLEGRVEAGPCQRSVYRRAKAARVFAWVKPAAASPVASIRSAPEPASQHPVRDQCEVAGRQQRTGDQAAHEPAMTGDLVVPRGENERGHADDCDYREDVDETEPAVIDVADAERYHRSCKERGCPDPPERAVGAVAAPAQQLHRRDCEREHDRDEVYPDQRLYGLPALDSAYKRTLKPAKRARRRQRRVVFCMRPDRGRCRYPT